MPKKDVGERNGGMIAHKLTTFRGLLQFCRNEIEKYCREHNLPPIPVVPDDGSMQPEAKAAFDFVRVQIIISPSLLDYIRPLNNTKKIWSVISAMRHELKHYEQYLSGGKITKRMFNENEALRTGRASADKSISRLTPDKINPFRHTSKGWYWGSKGPFPTRKKAGEVARAVHASGWTEHNPRKQKIFRTTCKRCGKEIYASEWSMRHPLGRICSECATPEEKEEILRYQSGAILAKGRRVNPASLYQSFHGVEPMKVRKIAYEPPKGRLIKIGRLSQINYIPEFPSERRNTEYCHEAGDTGSKKLKSNLILATDEKGKNLYLLKEKGSKYPIFTDRGIIG